MNTNEPIVYRKIIILLNLINAKDPFSSVTKLTYEDVSYVINGNCIVISKNDVGFIDNFVVKLEDVNSFRVYK